jgi:hypothetical protein
VALPRQLTLRRPPIRQRTQGIAPAADDDPVATAAAWHPWWAFDFRSGLQIVPGAAYTIGLGPSDGARALFLYLSFEHPF